MNALGTAGKALTPLFFILVTRLYGPELAGFYYAGWVVMEVALSLTLSGFYAGIMMFATRSLDDGRTDENVYQVFANGLVATLGVSLVLLVGVQVGALTILPRIFPRPGYVEALRVLVLSLPFTAVPALVASASKARLTMRWDALLEGLLRPLLLATVVASATLLRLGPRGLIWGHVIAEILRAGVALVVFGHLFSYRRLAAAVTRLRLFRPLFTFALPQNLNMAFSAVMTNVDVMMLAAFDVRPSYVLYYGMGAQIASNVRQARLVFSRAFEPLIARLHGRGDWEGLRTAFSQVSRWSTIYGLPLALAIIVLRHDLIRLFHGSFTGDTTFMVILIVSPMLACSFGTAGSIIVMTGHTGYNLANSMAAASLNGVLNYLLIPRMGINGAALATLLSTTTLTLVQLVEADRLARARIRIRSLALPYLAMLVPAGVAVAGLLYGVDQTLPGRLVIVLLCLGIFAATLRGWRFVARRAAPRTTSSN